MLSEGRWEGADGVVIAFADDRPQLVVTWPPIGSWSDVARYGFAGVLPEGSIARRVIEASFSTAQLNAILAAIRADPRCDQLHLGERRWSRTVERGGVPGDLVESTDLVVCGHEALVSRNSHSYGESNGSEEHTLTVAAFLSVDCPDRAPFADCLSRIDPYLTSLLAC
jgi:hypothetical protein